MKRILSPAILLMNRLSYGKKFTILWLLTFIAIVVVVYSLFVSLNRIIQPSQRQLDGLVLIKAISKTVQLVQQHRGFSSALLGGKEAMRDRRTTKGIEAAAAFSAMEGKLPSGLASGEDFRRIKADWEQLRKEGLHWAMDKNFAAHTGLIRQMRLFHAVAADEYALSMDMEIATFYLIDTIVNKLPDALEHFGQVRGYGTGILAGKQITEQQKIRLHSTITELDSALDELNINLGKTGRYNPAIEDSISAASRDITDSAQHAIDLVTSDILAGRFAMSPEVFLEMATVAIDKGYTQMYDTLLPTAESLIKARIARAKNTLYMSIGAAFVLFMMVAYFSVGIYYAVTDSIQALADSAHAFINGNLHKRVPINTSDELSRVGEIFNEMADGFSALLEKHHKAEKALSELTAYLQTVREEEKANLAREIHDDLSGTLAAIKMDIYWLESKLPKGLETNQMFDRIRSMSQLLDGAVTATRNIIADLRPAILDDLGLLAALEWQAAQFHKRTGIECRVNCIEDIGGMDKQQSIALFRIFQESLSNIARHSGASRVEVEFYHSNDEIALFISDNGCGMTRKGGIAANSYGLLGMTERVEQLGGKIKFDSPPGGGFNVTVILPLQTGLQDGEKA
ncbi:MAG: HAMP domain-containing protein [Nitrosomonadales bacterium]|nr:HAMP domain-containing protein [Nitrosomonadales bacterium]